MDVGKLRSVVDAAWSDYRLSDLPTLLANLASSFATSVQSPSPETADALIAARNAVMRVATEGHCGRLSQNALRILGKIGGADLCGPGLASAVDVALSASSSPALGVKQLQELRSRAGTFNDSIHKLHDSMDAMALAPDNPPTDDAEVDIALPCALFNGSLGGLAKEAKALDGALSDIVEAATGSRPPLKIHGLGTGSVEIFITVDPISGMAILGAFTAVLNTITSIMSYRKMQTQMKGDNAPENLLKALDDWERSRIDTELQAIKASLLALHKRDKTRNNELGNALTKSLTYLADRIDRGLSIEVSTALPPAGGDENEDHEAAGSDEATLARREAQEKILENMRTNRKFERPMEPVLRLLPPDEPDEDEASAKPGKPAK
jgi:hypothetical protein